LQVHLQPAEMKKRSAGQSIDEDVDIAVQTISTMQNGAEQARIGNRIPRYKRAYRRPILFENLRTSHCIAPTK